MRRGIMDQADHDQADHLTDKPTTSGLTIDLPNVRGERGKA
jgi:hypothetical protein